jgi:hypothetical protein
MITHSIYLLISYNDSFNNELFNNELLNFLLKKDICRLSIIYGFILVAFTGAAVACKYILILNAPPPFFSAMISGWLRRLNCPRKSCLNTTHRLISNKALKQCALQI